MKETIRTPRSRGHAERQRLPVAVRYADAIQAFSEKLYVNVTSP